MSIVGPPVGTAEPGGGRCIETARRPYELRGTCWLRVRERVACSEASDTARSVGQAIVKIQPFGIPWRSGVADSDGLIASGSSAGRGSGCVRTFTAILPNGNNREGVRSHRKGSACAYGAGWLCGSHTIHENGIVCSGGQSAVVGVDARGWE